MPIHLVFDLVAASLAFVATVLTYQLAPRGTLFGFGTLNLMLSAGPLAAVRLAAWRAVIRHFCYCG